VEGIALFLFYTMSRRKDNSTVPHTCPKIDTVIDFIENIEFHIENDTVYSKIDEMVKVMEDIRADNIELRAWGNSECDKKEDYEDDKEELEQEVRELKRLISDMEETISELQSQID
jgi:hypothetical protein